MVSGPASSYPRPKEARQGYLSHWWRPGCGGSKSMAGLVNELRLIVRYILMHCPTPNDFRYPTAADISGSSLRTAADAQGPPRARPECASGGARKLRGPPHRLAAPDRSSCHLSTVSFK